MSETKISVGSCGGQSCQYARNEQRRHTEKFIVKKAKTERLKNSSILYMQRLLNEDHQKKSTNKAH